MSERRLRSTEVTSAIYRPHMDSRRLTEANVPIESTKKQRAVFLDKDGTLVQDQPFHRNHEGVPLLPKVAEGLRLLQEHGFALVVVTNQGNVAKGLLAEEDVAGMKTQLCDMLLSFNVALAGFYFCPHHPLGSVPSFATVCTCRKPAPGLLLEAAEHLDLDLQQSWMVGDILDDIEAGRASGCRTILIDNGNETEWIVNSMRSPNYMAKDLLEAASFILCTDRQRQGEASSRHDELL
jgi:D-glycero-D-manno-heptose 1,7-bisphosphate phosphatase